MSWILALTLSMVSEDSASTDDIGEIGENLHIAMVMVPASGATSGVQTGFLNKHGGFFSHRGFLNRIILIQHILFQTKFTKRRIHYDRTSVSFMISPTNPLRHPQRPLYLTASIISHHHLLLVKSGCCCKVMSLRDGRSTKN